MARVEHIAEGVVLYMGDCRDIIPALPPYAAVVTDPPYGKSYQSGWATAALWAGGRKIANDDSTEARDQALDLCLDVPKLVFGTRKVLWPNGTRMFLTWDKGPALGMGALDLPWKPSSEEIYVIGRGFVGDRDESNVLYCPPVQAMAKNGRMHPNEKPVALLQRLIRKCPPGPILDPFMGSGSTGVAAIGLGRGFYGVESEQAYFDIACSQVAAATKQQDLFIEKPKPIKQEAML